MAALAVHSAAGTPDTRIGSPGRSDEMQTITSTGRHQIGSGASFSRSMENRLVTLRNGTAAISLR